MCTHHWLCESPAYKVVPARCKLCGEVRTFPAVPPDRPLTAKETAAVRLAKRRETRATSVAFDMTTGARSGARARAAAHRQAKEMRARTVLVERPQSTMTDLEERAWISMARDGSLRAFTGAHCGREGQTRYLAALRQRMADLERLIV